MTTGPSRPSIFSVRDRWIFITIGLAGFAFVYIFTCTPWDLTDNFFVAAPIGRDFVNFWVGGRLALAGDLHTLVDYKDYNLLIVRLFDHTPEDRFVFSYPPHSLLFFVPFALLPFTVSVWVWTAVNFLCVYASVQLLQRDRALGLIACLSPAVLIMAAYGHFGGVLGLLALVVLLRGHERPGLAGACLAVMTVKPQFAAVFGLFALLTGYWRAALVAVPFTTALVGISVLAFGVRPWIDFFQWTMPFHARLISEFVLSALLTTIPPYAGARMVGLPVWAAQGIQGLFGIAVVGAAAFLLIKRGPGPRTIALSLLALILALPYSNAYDLAAVAAPLTVAMFAERAGDGRLFLPLAAALPLWVLPPFAFHLNAARWPVLPVVFAATLLFALVREGMAMLHRDGSRPLTERPRAAVQPGVHGVPAVHG
jgi:alpha-1,2-mannosyltransferase